MRLGVRTTDLRTQPGPYRDFAPEADPFTKKFLYCKDRSSKLGRLRIKTKYSYFPVHPSFFDLFLQCQNFILKRMGDLTILIYSNTCRFFDT